MLCIGGVVVLIFIMSILEVSISPSSVMERSSSLLQQRSSSSSSGSTPPLQAEQVVEYKNPDGTDMDPKSIFMVRDFGASQCKAAFGEATLESTLPTEVRRERDEARATTWANTTKQNAFTLSLSWKRAMKTILPNWKEYTLGWVGQGVVLAPFPDRDGKDTIANTLVQIKLIRSMSTIPIEVWFETVQDVSEELHETLASWGAVVRTLDEDESIVRDGVVQLTNHEVDPLAVVPSGETPLTSIEVNDLRWKIGRNRAQHQRGLTVAALINSGFEEIVYYSPSTLPMQSPKSIFQQPDYIRTGALFWQHPTSFPAHDNPIWRIAQVDCNPTTFQQSWSAIALKHKDAWKGLFLAWHWLSGEEHATYEAAFGSQGHDLLRLAWMAVKRPYAMIERMPQPGAGIGKIELLDLSQAKGEGIGCNLGSSLYPTPGSDVLVNPFQFAKDQYLQKKRGKTDQDDFTPNRNVMLLDTSPDSAVINAGSNDRTIHNALDLALKDSRQPTTLLLTDVYAAGSGGRVCLKISQRRKGHRHV
ncbi:hypothetical protein BGZ99_000813 [Dissophora globulifera]|uniref:Uncharacterized protein n=1 Tax=Dissophora globulifera TaxID=979702 RepID=A0A9P6UY42_9FUNG|nr:hypothetical protein BGZ99_000813 [Dissophora globulifera]